MFGIQFNVIPITYLNSLAAQVVYPYNSCVSLFSKKGSPFLFTIMNPLELVVGKINLKFKV